MVDFEERRGVRVRRLPAPPATARVPARSAPKRRRPPAGTVAPSRSAKAQRLFEGADDTRIVRRTDSIGPQGGPVDGAVESRIRSSAGGRPMGADVRAPMEAAFGTDFGDVRVHADSDVAQQIGAVAFTWGRDVHFAAGAYAPTTASGQRVLAHELAHVVQQDPTVRRLEIEGGDTKNLVALFKYDKDEMKNPWNFARKFGPFGPDQKFSTKEIPATVRSDVEAHFNVFKDLTLDLNNVSNALGQKKAQAQRRAIRRDMQREFDTIISTLQMALDDVADHLDEQVEKAGDALYKDRMARQPAMTGSLKKFQEKFAWPVVDPFKDAEVLIGLDPFRELVKKNLSQIVTNAAQAATALTPAEQLALTAEQNAVNTQLNIWNTTDNLAGMNPDGTWGTSAGGAAGHFAPTTVSQRVWRRLRKWWLSKAGAWVAPSLTTDWSLKLDQDTTNLPARSPRINYHVNVA